MLRGGTATPCVWYRTSRRGRPGDNAARRAGVTGQQPCVLVGKIHPRCSQITARFAVAATAVAKHMVLQPCSLEGVTGGIRRWSGVRRLRLRALRARGPGGTGNRPGSTTTPTDSSYRLTATPSASWKRAANGSATRCRPTPCGAPKGAAFLPQKGRGRACRGGIPRKACTEY